MNYIGTERTNYVELGDGLTRADLEAHLDLIGFYADVQKKEGRFAFFASSCDSGVFNYWLSPEPVESSKYTKEQLRRAADALGVDVSSLLGEDGAEELPQEMEFSWGMIMPLVAPGHVLVVMAVGSEGARYVSGNASAYVRDDSGEVRETHISLESIYDDAVKILGVDGHQVTRAEY